MGTGLSIHCCETCNLPSINSLLCCTKTKPDPSSTDTGSSSSENSQRSIGSRIMRRKKKREKKSGPEPVFLKNPQIKLESIVPSDMFDCGYFIYDSNNDCIVVATGDSHTALLGLEPEQIVGRALKKLPPRARSIVELCRRTTSGSGSFLQIQMMFVQEVVLVITFPIFDNNNVILGALIICRPMPDRKYVDLSRFVVGTGTPSVAESGGEAVPMRQRAVSNPVRPGDIRMEVAHMETMNFNEVGSNLGSAEDFARSKTDASAESTEGFGRCKNEPSSNTVTFSRSGTGSDTGSGSNNSKLITTAALEHGAFMNKKIVDAALQSDAHMRDEIFKTIHRNVQVQEKITTLATGTIEDTLKIAKEAAEVQSQLVSTIIPGKPNREILDAAMNGTNRQMEILATAPVETEDQRRILLAASQNAANQKNLIVAASSSDSNEAIIDAIQKTTKLQTNLIHAAIKAVSGTGEDSDAGAVSSEV